MFEDQDYTNKECHEEQDVKYIGLIVVGASFVIACCITLANI